MCGKVRCVKCGKEYDSLEEARKCYSEHLGLTYEEYLTYLWLKQSAVDKGLMAFDSKDENMEKEFDNAINALASFKREHKIELARTF